MASLSSYIFGWFGWGGGALGEKRGVQNAVPITTLVEGSTNIGPDSAMQISTVWACIERRAMTIASLPFFAYETKAGEKTLARSSRLYSLLHESPNARMTPLEFWRAMIMNYDLRGNAYARIDRAADGEAIGLWPMPADQVQPNVLLDGSMVYYYRIDSDVAVLAEQNVLHLKNLGNGTVGLQKLEFMRPTTNEVAGAQTAATKLFTNGGKPTGVLMVDQILTPEQRTRLKENFSEMQTGTTARLYVLEANMKFQQLSLSPEDQQLLETRKLGIEEICRWLDVPPVLIHHSNVTAWGTGIEQIVDGFHKFTIRPLCIAIEQVVRKRVMTAKQRSNMSAEFSLDALLRGNIKDRYEVYAKGVQNGILTRNEARQLENLPPDEYANDLTAQTNLAPLELLGKIQSGGKNAIAQDTQAQ